MKSLIVLLIFLICIWTRGGIQTIYFDTDLARDLYQLSNIWTGKVVWLGPWLSIGFNTSPIYYYMYFPFLWLGGGNVQAIFYGNAILAAAALGLFGLLCKNKYFLLAVAFIGLSPWWQEIAFHPGNGFSYAIFVFAALTALYFKMPLIISSLLLGIAISFHPASLVVLPIFIYEVLRKKGNLVIFILGLLIPWSPIVLFEFITKGFLTRQLIAHHSLGTTFLSYYFYGLICLLLFFTVIISLKNRFGKYFLSVGIIIFALLTLTHPPVPASRTVPQIESVVNYLINSNSLEKTQKIAVVAALFSGTGVPQADDYRFFLRVKGFNVLDVPEYSKADTLIEFIEQPNFDFKNWSTWEIDQFGKRKLIKNIEINNIIIAIYEKV